MALRTICIFAFAASTVNGFAAYLLKSFQPETANPSLESLAKAPTGTLFDLRLDIGNDVSRMGLQGLELELTQEPLSDKRAHPSLPGVDGPNSSVSAGAKKIDIKKDASFVSMSGHQNVPLRNGCWEMVWRDNAPAGVIVCAFDLQETVKRNDASLEKGRVYMSFPVWTREGLDEQQEYRRKIEAKARLFQSAKKEAYKAMDATSNPIMKALHFREAAEASEKLSYVPTNSITEIPMDDDVVSLGKDNLLIIKQGTVWNKDQAMFGNDQHTLLGTVTIRSTQDIL